MDIGKFLERNSGTILAVLGCGFTVGACFFSGKNTLRARELLETKQSEQNEPLTKKETIRTVWKCYIPTCCFLFASIGCSIASDRANHKAQAAILTAYATLKTTYDNYKEEVRNVYGEDADQRVKESYFKNHHDDPEEDLQKKDDGKELYYIMPCTNEALCRYVRCEREDIWNAVYHSNRNMALGGEVTVNDFYGFLGCEPVPGGDEIGWGTQYIELGLYWIDFSEEKTETDDGLDVTIVASIFEPEEIL